MGALEPGTGAPRPAVPMLSGTGSFAKEPPGPPDAAAYYGDGGAPEPGTPSLPYGAPGGFGGRFLGPCPPYRAPPPPAAAPVEGYAVEGYAGYPGAEDTYGPGAGPLCPRGGHLCALPGYRAAGKVQVMLNNYPLWAKFHKHQTEMIITKQGSFNLSGLNPVAHYSVCVDVVLVDQHHWRYQGGKWVQCGKAEGNMPGNRLYLHPDSPNTGAHWMRQEVSFGKLKLTNNKGASNNVGQMIVLQSLHKYQPRLHVTEVKEGEGEEGYPSPHTHTFAFPETQFIAVTAYQNADITQLKIDHNPFAKGFRDNFDSMYAASEGDRLTPSPPEGLGCQQLLPAPRFQPFLPEQYSLPPGRFFGGERGAPLPLPPKDPPRWYFTPQQPPAAGPLDYGGYEAGYGGGKLVPYGVKPFALPPAPHHPPLPYYPEGPGGFAAGGGWSPGQYGPKGSPGALGWYREPREEKGKEAEGWAPEPPAPTSGDSSDSGLYECKRRRVSPYPSSTESSPQPRNGDFYDKDPGTDSGYYGFYGN
ncbi:eomesodermin-like isoform X2 [Colius striatus]|uniref:eomesodermin-like isoform X2 n=1 Tax=Colius striatus TaxID=57412 RepID=UPI002B1D2515|nr:eomesodermin-like isoform X2 [Colius striatus]